MVSRSALLTSLALMWQWPRNSSKTSLASFFRISSVQCAFTSHNISFDLFFPRHFAVFLLHENVVVPLIACLLSSRCVCRGQKQQAVLVEARLKQEARIAELEAKLAVLEPYRTFVEQVRRDMQSKEHGGRWMTDELGPEKHNT